MLRDIFNKAQDQVKNLKKRLENAMCRPPQEGDEVLYCSSINAPKEKKFLGKLINKGGGEGSIYQFDDLCVAKIYKKIILDDSSQKIRRNKLEKLVRKKIKGASLPNGLLFDLKENLVGYTMPLVCGENLDSFIRRNRKNSNWEKDASGLCLSILKVIKNLHQEDIILGDINGSNILVEDIHKVHFIDTDSYQVDNYPCPVGKEEFTAPEIQSMEYKTFLRTMNHENYAISTLIFMIFMRSRKPYDRIDGGTDSENIKNGIFPYPIAFSEERGIIPVGPWLDYWNSLNNSLKEALFNSFNKEGIYFAPSARLDCRDWMRIISLNSLRKPFDMSEQLNIKDEEFASNPAKRVSICICLDLSGSMMAIENSEYDTSEYTIGMSEGRRVKYVKTNENTITRIGELRKGLDVFFNAIRENPDAHDGAEIAIIGFNYDPVLLLDFNNIDNQVVPKLEAAEGSPTYMGKAVEMGLELLEKRKNYYKKMGAPYYQPFLVVMSDGDDNDNPVFINRASEKTRKLISEKKLIVIPVGIGKDANLLTLGKLSNNGAYRLKNLNFEKFFIWLSASVSGNELGSEPDIDKWGEIE